MKIFYGANKWGATDWVGNIYPERTREGDFLSEYTKHFNAIELHATYYQLFTHKQVQRWVDKAEGKDFLFCPTFPQAISRYSSFKNIDERTNDFLDSILPFADHLGPVFLQVGDKFAPEKKRKSL